MMELNISDIQHFSVGDGDGIRTTVFLKGCSLRCPWCHNPETISAAPQTLTFAQAGRTVTYGRRMNVEAVVDEVLEDTDFYRTSGGGVTLGGGEPLLQSEAVAELAKALRDKDIHVIIDTAGHIPWEAFERVLPYANTFFYDWKTSDAALCRNTLGGDIDRIRSNLGRLVASGAAVRVRIPLIPGVNTSPEATDAMISDLGAAGVRRVDLLPFHRLAVGKYDAMGLSYAYRNTPPLPPKEVEAIAARYRAYFVAGIEK